MNVYDRCVLTLDGKKEENEDENRTQGIIVIEVDDVLEAGGPRHQALMKKLESIFTFGKVVELQQHPEGAAYAGRRVMQDKKDYSFSHTMADYILNRLPYVTMSRRVAKKDAGTTPLSPEEEGQLRGAIASVNWVAREGRPDASAAASILARAFPSPMVSHVLAVNQVIERLKTNHVVMKVHSIPEDQIRHFVISDSAFDKSGNEKSQHGWLQGVTTPDLNAGREAPVSLIAWRSRKLRRKAANTLLCESIAMSAAVGALEKQVAMWQSFRLARFDPRSIAVDDETARGLRGTATVIAEDAPEFTDPAAVAVVDAKSLFDSAATEQAQGDDDRAALEVAIIQESMAKLKGRMRWIPHNYNPADALTKLQGAHEEPLHRLLSRSSFRIEEEKDVLARGKQSECRMKTKLSSSHVKDNFGG